METLALLANVQASTALAIGILVGLAALGFAAMLPVSAAFVGTSMQTFNRLMLFQSWI